jgi:hypothetical protein
MNIEHRTIGDKTPQRLGGANSNYLSKSTSTRNVALAGTSLTIASAKFGLLVFM